MKNTKAIVSLADDKYFSLLIELINSIKNFPESKDVAICILDAGLSNDNKKLLEPLVKEIKKAEWDIKMFLIIKFKEENGLKVKYQEHFYLNIFQSMRNIFG